MLWIRDQTSNRNHKIFEVSGTQQGREGTVLDASDGLYRSRYAVLEDDHRLVAFLGPACTSICKCM